MKSEEQALVNEQNAERKKEEDERLRKEAEELKREEELLKKKRDLRNEINLLMEEDDREREILKLEQDAEKLLKEEEDNATRVLIKRKLRQQIKAVNDKFDAEEEKTKKEKAQKDIDRDKAVAQSKAQVSMDTLGVMADIFGRESAAGKALAVAQATMNTYQAATNALANTPAPPPFPQIAAGVAVASGLMQVGKIMNTQEPKKMAQGGLVGGYGSGTSDSVNARLSRGETVINAKSTRMFKPLLSAINQAGGGIGFADGGTLDTGSAGMTTGVVKAFVVADEMTNEQNRLTRIRRKATI